MYYCPPCLSSGIEKKFIEGTSQEARKRQGILKKKKWKCRTILFLLSFQKIQVNAADEITLQIDTTELCSIPPNYYILLHRTDIFQNVIIMNLGLLMAMTTRI